MINVLDDGRGDDLGHVVRITETVGGVGAKEATGTSDVDITTDEGGTDTTLGRDRLQELDKLLLLLGVDVASPGVDLRILKK